MSDHGTKLHGVFFFYVLFLVCFYYVSCLFVPLLFHCPITHIAELTTASCLAVLVDLSGSVSETCARHFVSVDPSTLVDVCFNMIQPSG